MYVWLCDVMMMSLARKFGPRPWKDDTASDGREVYRVEPPTIVKVGARLGPGKATLDPVCHPPPPSPWGAGPHGFFLSPVHHFHPFPLPLSSSPLLLLLLLHGPPLVTGR